MALEFDCLIVLENLRSSIMVAEVAMGGPEHPGKINVNRA